MTGVRLCTGMLGYPVYILMRPLAADKTQCDGRFAATSIAADGDCYSMRVVHHGVLLRINILWFQYGRRADSRARQVVVGEVETV